MLLCGTRDRDPGVLARAWINAMRRHEAIAVTVRTLHAAVGGEFQNGRRKKMHRRLRLRQVDVLSAPGAATIFQRGQNRANCETGRDTIGVGTIRSRGWPIWPSAEIAEPGDGSREIAIASEFRKRASLPHEATTDHYDLGLDLFECRVIQAEAAHRLGRE